MFWGFLEHKPPVETTSWALAIIKVQGFPAQFWDSKNPSEDQIHHFGAYCRAGIAGHKFAADVHRADDRDNGNMGDVRLSDQARRLGDYLRRNPSQLDKIGQLIRDTICNGGPVPK